MDIWHILLVYGCSGNISGCGGQTEGVVMTNQNTDDYHTRHAMEAHIKKKFHAKKICWHWCWVGTNKSNGKELNMSVNCLNQRITSRPHRLIKYNIKELSSIMHTLYYFRGVYIKCTWLIKREITTDLHIWRCN